MQFPFRIVLGTDSNNSSITYEEIILEDNLCDNEWHQVDVRVREDYVTAKVDVSPLSSPKTKHRLIIDDKVVIGGLTKSNTNKQTLSNRNYIGCLSYVVLGKREVLKELFKQHRYLRWSCDDNDKFDAINFDKRKSYVQFVNPIASLINVGLRFRSYLQDGVLITNQINNHTTVKGVAEDIMGFALFFKDNVLRLQVNKALILSIRPKEDIDFGSWHEIRLSLNKDAATVSLGTQTKTAAVHANGLQNFGETILIGKETQQVPNFLGWIWRININGKLLSYSNATRISAVNIGTYKMEDHCFPNKCNNTGRCIQSHNGSRCNCSNTSYTGETCSQPKQGPKRTCHEYFMSGNRINGMYMIKPGSKEFQVYCEMDGPDGTTTVVQHKQGRKLRTVYETAHSDNDFYKHLFDYKVDMKEVDELVQASDHCRQYIKYFCSHSTLMYSNDKENALVNRYGARWFSRDGQIRNYWGGAVPDSFSCECGMKGNCADPSLKCNCDLMDKTWRSDGGYLRNKEDLPVTKIQFSRRYTNPSSMYELGPLECFGKHVATTARPTVTTKPTSPLLSTGVIEGATLSRTSKHGDITTNGLQTTKSTTKKQKTQNTENSKKTSTTTKGRKEAGENTSSSINVTLIPTFEKTGGSLSAKTRLEDTPKTTIRSLIVNRPAQQVESAMSNKQMFILIALISSLALLTILLIVAVLRQRIFKSNKNLTIKMKHDPENGNEYEAQREEKSRLSSDIDSKFSSASDLNRIEIIKVASPYRKSTASESGSSVSSFDTSRYLEVGDESDSGSSSSFSKPKGILKSKNKFMLSSRSRSEGDQFEVDNPTEVIGLIHVNGKNNEMKHDETSALLSDNIIKDTSDVQFHLHPSKANHFARNNSGQFSCSDRESIDAETGFLTDTSSTCDSRKSLSSSGSDESNDESYSRKYGRRPKRSVRFSIQELKPKNNTQVIMGTGMCQEGDDEVFS